MFFLPRSSEHDIYHVDDLAGVEEVIRGLRAAPSLTDARTKRILQHVADHHYLPSDVTEEEKQRLEDLVYVDHDEASDEDAVYLTTLGEMTLEELGGTLP